MIIECKGCKRRFNVDDERIPSTGSKVQCSKCGEMFVVEKISSVEEPESLKTPIESQNLEIEDDVTNGSSMNEQEIEISQVDETENIEEQDAPYESIFSEVPEIEDDTEVNWEDVKINPLEELDDEPLQIDEGSQDGNERQERENSESLFGFTVPIETDEITTDSETESSDVESSYVKSDIRPSEFEVDHEKLFRAYNPADTKAAETTQQQMSRPQTVSRTQFTTMKKPSKKKGFIKRMSIPIFTLFLVSIFAIVAIKMLTEFNIVSSSSGLAEISTKIDSINPFIEREPDFNRVVSISDLTGRWVSTRYGFVYLLSGEIKNSYTKPINYVKLRTEFRTAGEKLFSQELYAGNTLSTREVRNLSFESVSQKLNRKNGDIDFDNINKLAGLNFNIEPNEKIPFYSVFPSKSKLLGLKYSVEVIDLETALTVSK